MWENEDFFIRGNKAGKKWEGIVSELDLYIAPRFMGYDDDDSDELSGMEDRDYSLDVGVQFHWKFQDLEGLSLSTSFAGDALGENEGLEATAELAYFMDFKPLFIKPSIGVQWQSENMVDYYYGVMSSEVTASRGQYSPDSAVNGKVGLDVYMAHAGRIPKLFHNVS